MSTAASPSSPDVWPLEVQGIAVPKSQKPGYSHIYRNACVPHLNINITAHDVFIKGRDIDPNADCLGWRPWNDSKADFENYFSWISYSQVEEQRTAIGSALSKIALDGILKPKSTSSSSTSSSSEPDVGLTEWTVGLWLLNRPEYQITDLSCVAYSRRSVSLYDSYDTPTAVYILEHSEARILFTTPSHIAAILSEVQKGNLPLLRAVVLLDSFRGPADAPAPSEVKKNELAKQWAATLGIRLFTWNEMLDLGRANPFAHIVPTPKTIATFCYTSGTTGKPKGAIITHEMTAFAATSLSYHIKGQQTMISYLPTAHIYARGVELLTLSNGGRVGCFCGDTTRLVEDMQILQPTFFPSVPRVLNRIAALIEAQMRAPGLKASLLRAAVAAKVANHDATGSVTHAFYDRLVFRKVKAVLGGNVAFVVSGSAPIRPDVLKLLRVALCCDIREGYGQTENVGSCLIMNPLDKELGTCGPPIPGTEIVLKDVPEMGYTAQDKPYPRGELLNRGQQVFVGYYKDEAKTREALDEERWLHSGDVVEVDDKGRFRIIDRVKNLVKLSQGEYVAIDALSEIYGGNPLSLQLLVHGDSYRDYLIGVSVPDPVTFAPFASKILGRQISETDTAGLEAACKEPKVIQAYLQEFVKLARQNKFKGFEFMKGLHLTMDPFSIENGLLTPTFKVKRHEVIKYYQEQIDKLYEQGPVDVKAGVSKL
ncbi:acetyl-CoA synthetase-like protein [Violaceomyces palustris]|uniref:Acetyl-CoA synthetase-like protein n=1 Tax=Violaceomyces palustris TaxID=1673888 RepID=A0ACD0P5L6_9BASI|nr:acetyl-CoA synthetase-like protein [Violaceomyces palustris]